MKRLGTVGVYTVIFAALGPLIGAVCFFVYLEIRSPGPWSFPDLLAPGMSLVYLFLVYGGYLYGAIPAAATGFTCGLVVSKRRLGHLLHMALGFGIGFLACTLYQIVLSAMQGSITALVWAFLVAGAISGSVCGLLCSYMPVGPNNSFKPNPLRGSA